MVSEKVTVKSEHGLHMRPAGELVKTATKFKSDINIMYCGKNYSAKSIMNIMSAGIKKDSEIFIVCNGDDEATALKELTTFFDTKLS